MLPYFPAVYPDELLYSVLARYHRHIGLPCPMQTMQSLFGKKNAIASIDLQGYLADLAIRIPPERGLTVNRIIESLTLFPYVTAFEPPTMQTQVKQSMVLGNVENLHVRLGLTTSRVGRIQKLRFCLQCSKTMIANYEELYWRRDHQISSVLVCPEHGCPLMESDVSFIQHSRYEFVAATPDNCPQNARTIISLTDQVTLSHLHSLARLSNELLNNPQKPRTFTGWTAYYRNKMIEAELTLSDCRMDQQRLSQEIRSFYGCTLNLLPNVLDGSKFTGNWLKAMVRKHRKATHPLYHLLVQNFLAQRDLAKREIHVSLFGAGPWKCLNPLAKHRATSPIKDVVQHSNHGKITGVFTCTCGYVYTRSFNSITKKVGQPRFQEYGALLEPALRKLIAADTSRRKIGEVLQLDPKTVFRLTSKLDITDKPVQSKDPSKNSPKNKSERNTQVNKKLGKSPNKGKSTSSRRDWVEVDQVCIAKISSLAAIILKESPPVRITYAELDRRMGKRDWLLTHKSLLPMTKAFLDSTLESTESFQLRRIRWAIHELDSASGTVKAWQVLRKTGLRSTDHLERIKAELESAPALWGIAA